MENDIYIFKQKTTFRYRLYVGMVMVFGLFMINFFVIGGVMLSFGSLFFLFLSDGFEIDFKKLAYRNSRMLGKLSIGTWEKLPEIKYISVFKTTLSSGVVGRSNVRIAMREKTILISFVYGRNKRLMVYRTSEIEDAFEKARYFSEKLNLKIYDAATFKKGQWLEN